MNTTQILTQRVYRGEFPDTCAGYYALTQSSYRRSFVYVLFDIVDRPLYVGMSFRPGNRFDRHRRKPWWPEVHSVSILQVDGPSRDVVVCATRDIESATIHAITPAYNIAGVVH